jgi:hypothetical protein
VGVLGGAATKLATTFGDTGLRSDLTELKGVFQGVARNFVDAFEPIIRGQIIPAARTFAAELNRAIPKLADFTETHLPSLLSAALGLVNNIVDVAQVMGTTFSVFDLLIEVVEGLIESMPALAEELTDTLTLGAVDFDIWRDSLDETLQSLSTSTRDVFGTGAATERALFGTEAQSPTEQLRAEMKRIFGEEAAASLFSGGGLSGDGPLSGLDKGVQEFEEVRREIEGIGRAMERGVLPRSEGLQQQFQAAKDALVSMAKQGLTDTEQFESFKALLADIRAQAKEAGVAVGQMAEEASFSGFDFVKTFKKRLREFREAARDTTVEGTVGLAGQTPPSAIIAGALPDQVSGPQMSISRMAGLAETAGSIKEINTLVAATRNQFDVLANQEARDFIGRLQRMRKKMQEAKDAAEAMKDVLVEAVKSTSRKIGSRLADSLFADREKLQRLREKRRSIQQNLRQARKAENYEQVRQLTGELEKVNKRLSQTETLFGRIGQALSDFGNLAKQVLEDVISKLLSAAFYATIVSAVTGGSSLAVSGMSGFSSFGSFFTEGLTGLADGGIATGPTAAMIGEGNESEAVMPLSKLETLIEPATPAAAPASPAPSANVNVNLAAEARMEGSELVVVIRKALNEEERLGGPGTL